MWVRHVAVWSYSSSSTFYLWASDFKDLSVKVMPCEHSLWYRHRSKDAPIGWRYENSFSRHCFSISSVVFSCHRRKTFARLSVDARDMLKWVSTPGSYRVRVTNPEPNQVCVCVGACVRASARASTRGGDGVGWGWGGELGFNIESFSDCSSPYYLSQGLSLDLEITH